MHHEDHFFTVETNIKGQRLLGFAYAGLRSLTVHMVRPFDGFSDNVHLPYFAMGVHPDGFTGEYGRTRALDLLVGLYDKHSDCTCTRRAALPYLSGGRAFDEFGSVRFLQINPGHGGGTDVLDIDLDEDVFVRPERTAGRFLMRFYDRETRLPFLAEACVLERDSPAYIAGVLEDGGFHRHVLRVHERLLDSMRRYRALLSEAGINEQQLRLLQAPDKGELVNLNVQRLLTRGYLLQTAMKSESEKQPLLQRVERQLAEAARLERSGTLQDAARIRKRAADALQRIHATRLERTTAGFKLMKSFPSTGVIWD